jgi:hypothetical protein
MDYLRCSDEDVHRLVDDLYQQIRASGYQPDSIIGIGSGGFMVLRLLLDRFRGAGTDTAYIPIVARLYTQLGETGELEISCPPNNIEGGKALMTDDVADTGTTLNGVFEHYIPLVDEIRVATLHKKPQSIVVPNYYAGQTDKWIIYPWGVMETTREIIEGKMMMEIRDIEKELKRAGISREELERFQKILSPDDSLTGITGTLMGIY